MPTGYYKRKKYHIERLKEGHKNSLYKITPEHKAKIATSIKIYWENKKRDTKVCSKRKQIIKTD
jgi:hypothetical protein